MARNGMTNRKKQALKTKKKILDAAIKLMQKQGIQQTTVEAICKRAKVSIGSFYNYFKSKEEVLNSVFEPADTYFHEVVEKELDDLPSKEKIVLFFRHYARYNVDTGLDFTKHLYFNAENKWFIERNRYMHTLLRSILDEGLDHGKCDTGFSADEMEEFLFLVARGVVCDWCLHDGDYDLEEKMVMYFNNLTCILCDAKNIQKN